MLDWLNPGVALAGGRTVSLNVSLPFPPFQQKSTGDLIFSLGESLLAKAQLAHTRAKASLSWCHGG